MAVTDEEFSAADLAARYGRGPRPQDLLDRHLARTGAGRAVHEEPAAMLQVNLLRMFLDLLHSACDDERLDPAVIRRILDKVIYGSVPQQPVVNQVLHERSRMVEHLTSHTHPYLLPEELRAEWGKRL